MANTKKAVTDSATESESTENKTDNSVNIEEIIKKAVAETANKYESQIVEYQNKIHELENKVSDTPTHKERVKIMYMGAGRANFSKGRINITFEKPFDTREVRYEIFLDMFDTYYQYFTSFELVIVDKDVREEMGLEYNFEDHGADKTTFEEMLKGSATNCLHKLDKLSYDLDMTFLKYFVDEYIQNNRDAVTKFSDITNYYETKFNITEIQETIREMSH